MTTVERAPGRLYGPPGFDSAPFRAMLAEDAFTGFSRSDAAFRRGQCRLNPLLS